MGIEFTLMQPIPKDVADEKEYLINENHEIINRLITNENIQSFTKRGFYSKLLEDFIKEKNESRVIVAGSDNPYLECTTLPYELTSKNIAAVTASIYDDICLAARLLSEAGLDPATAMLSTCLPNQRVSGMHLNLSGFKNAYAIQIFKWLLTIFAVAHGDCIEGIRSARINHLTDSCIELDADAVKSSMASPPRFSRGCSTQLSCWCIDFPGSLEKFQRLFAFLIELNTYISEPQNIEKLKESLLTIPEPEFVALIRKVNRGDKDVSKKLTVLLNNSLNQNLCNLLNIAELTSPIQSLEPQRYYTNLLLAEWLKNNFAYRESLPGRPQVSLVNKEICGPIIRSFKSFTATKKRVASIDWNLSEIIIDNEIAVLPNNYIFNPPSEINETLMERCGIYLNEFNKAYPRLKIGQVRVYIRDILYNRKSLNFDLFSDISKYNISRQTFLLFLTWLADRNQLTNSTAAPYKYNWQTYPAEESWEGTKASQTVSESMVKSLYFPFTKSIFQAYNNKIKVARILAPEPLYEKAKNWKAIVTRLTKIEMAGPEDFLEIYEQPALASVSSLLSVETLYRNWKNETFLFELEIDRPFLLHLLNKAYPFDFSVKARAALLAGE